MGWLFFISGELDVQSHTAARLLMDTLVREVNENAGVEWAYAVLAPPSREQEKEAKRE